MLADLLPALVPELLDLRGLTLRQPWNWAHGGMNGWWRVGEGARVAIGEAWRAAGRAA